MIDPGKILNAILDHINLVGWPVFIGVTWKFRGKVDGFMVHVKEVAAKVEATEAVAGVIKADVDRMTNNHLAHIQRALEGEQNYHEQQLKVLQNIDKGIAILVDRGK